MQALLTVVVITYNHENYIKQCIESLLSQSFTQFELIIVDDESTDNTRKIIETFNDARIIYHYQKNMGPSGATNTGIALAKTEFISLLSGDDMAYPHRLAHQYDYFIKHPQTAMLFGRCDIIDQNGIVRVNHPLEQLFNQFTYSDRYRLFHHFFFGSNCLCAVTCMFRRSIVQEMGGFHYPSLQLQDFMLWFQCLKQFDITILEEKLAYYRVCDDGKNLSDKKNINRVFFEQSCILEHILDHLDLDFFKKTFSKEMKNDMISDPISFELEKAFLYLNHPHPEIKKIGMKKLFFLLQEEKYRNCFLEKYHLKFKDYFDLTGSVVFWDYDLKHKYDQLNSKYAQLYSQTKRFLPIIQRLHKIKSFLRGRLNKKV